MYRRKAKLVRLRKSWAESEKELKERRAAEPGGTRDFRTFYSLQNIGHILSRQT
jgi:hypothetical protein